MAASHPDVDETADVVVIGGGNAGISAAARLIRRGITDVTVVATGHTAPLMLPELHTVDHYDKHLTLDGLRMVYERNQDSQRGRPKQAH